MYVYIQVIGTTLFMQVSCHIRFEIRQVTDIIPRQTIIFIDCVKSMKFYFLETVIGDYGFKLIRAFRKKDSALSMLFQRMDK